MTPLDILFPGNLSVKLAAVKQALIL